MRQRVKDSSYEKADMFDSMIQHGDSIQFGESGWKNRYYRMKFPDVADKQRQQLIKDMTEKFVEGLAWVMAYYYDGVASWTWYYPYHYAPFASDMLHIAHIRPKFNQGEPFLPVNQLMAVLPAASRFCLPEVNQQLGFSSLKSGLFSACNIFLWIQRRRSSTSIRQTSSVT